MEKLCVKQGSRDEARKEQKEEAPEMASIGKYKEENGN